MPGFGRHTSQRKMPEIYPLDCLILGNCSSVMTSDEPRDPNRRALHFWGYSRDETLAFKDNTRLCYVSYYEPTASSSHGKPDNPIYESLKLQYLGVRLRNIENTLLYFRTHFILKEIIADEMAFTTSGGAYRRVLSRWPDSNWYFLSPRGTEGVAQCVNRENVWHAWNPQLKKDII